MATIVIPWRDSSPVRATALARVRNFFAGCMPGAPLILADSGHQPFSVAASRNAGVRAAGDGVVVICDADIIPDADALREAVAQAAHDGRLHIPYTRYRALSPASTRAALAGARLLECATDMETEGSQGGVLVMDAQAWQDVGGMDERFVGWGFEDAAFHAAVTTLHGDVVRHDGTIHHLWHPSDINFVSPEYAANRALCQRYEAAHGDLHAMRALQAEHSTADRRGAGVNAVDVIAAWNEPSARAAIHPTRGISEDAYEESGRMQAGMLAAEIPAGAKVMDFGCGDGRVAVPLRALGYEVTGVDASPRMLAALAERDPELTVFQSDGSDLGKHLGRRKMDAVYCLAVLIHHGYDDGAEIIGRLAKVVRKGGLLILDWPTADQPRERADWIDVTTWSPDQQTAVADKVGLTRVDTALPWSAWTT